MVAITWIVRGNWPSPSRALMLGTAKLCPSAVQCLDKFRVTLGSLLQLPDVGNTHISSQMCISDMQFFFQDRKLRLDLAV